MKIDMKKYFKDIRFESKKAKDASFKEVEVTFIYKEKRISYFIFIKKGNHPNKYYLDEAKKIFDKDCKTIKMKRYVNSYIDAINNYPHRKLAYGSIALVALLAIGGGILAWKLLSNGGDTPVEANTDCIGEHCTIDGLEELKKHFDVGADVELTLKAEDGYMLPTLPDVFFGDRKAIYDEEYTYDYSTGKINFVMPEGDVKIIAEAISPVTEITYHYDDDHSIVTFIGINSSIGTEWEVDWDNGSGPEKKTTNFATHDYKDDGAKAGDVFVIKITNVEGIETAQSASEPWTNWVYNISKIKFGSSTTRSAFQMFSAPAPEYASILENVTFPNSMPGIFTGAYEDCKEITSVAIPDSMCAALNDPESLMTDLFSRCDNITDVVLPRDLKIITGSMFSQCTKLVHINFPAALESIAGEAFNKTGLEKVVFPKTLKNIGVAAFMNCSKLTKIDMTSFDDATAIPSAAHNSFMDINENAKFYVSSEEMRDAFIAKGNWPTSVDDYVVVS